MLNNEATLRRIIDDPSTSDVERAEALRELDAECSVTAADTRLENELLFEHHCSTLADIQHHDLHAFCSNHRFSAAAQNLYMKWLEVSPAAQQKMQQMRRHLETYFLAGYDAMLARYKAALDGGGDLNAANSEALRFYRDWVDSCVTPQELRPHFRQLIAELSARCEAPRENK